MVEKPETNEMAFCVLLKATSLSLKPNELVLCIILSRRPLAKQQQQVNPRYHANIRLEHMMCHAGWCTFNQ